MSRKTGQGRISEHRGLRSKSDGAHGGLSFVNRKGKSFLAYKTSAGWYYVPMTRSPLVNTKNIITGKKDSLRGYLKNRNKENIVARRLNLIHDVSFTNTKAYYDGCRGVGLLVGKLNGDQNEISEGQLMF